MSIFPKRTVAGETITIHTNVLSHDQQQVIYPYLRTIIRSPTGEVYTVFSGHVLIFPGNVSQDHYKANQGFPFLLLAQAVQSKSAEQIESFVERIRQGRHFYYHFTIPADAPPGKYIVETENWLKGHVATSTTAAEDHFYVEQVTLVQSERTPAGIKSIIKNHSSEPLPTRIVKMDAAQNIQSEVMILPGAQTAVITFNHQAFLLYNEERKCLALVPAHKTAVIRNQRYVHTTMDEDDAPVTYVMNDAQDVVSLQGLSHALWHQAEALNMTEEALSHQERDMLHKMYDNNLLKQVDLENLLESI